MPRFLSVLLLVLTVPAAAFAKPTLDAAYGSIPLAFTLNEGQAHSSITFTAQGSGCGMAFSPTGTTFLFSRETPASVTKRAAKRSVVFEDDPTRDQPEYESFALKLAFVGANENSRIQGEDHLPWNNNYFIGNDASKWRTDVPNYGKIRLTEVYDGIDLVYYGNQKRVKYDFVVKPGEDPEQILLKYDFGQAEGSLLVNVNGELVVKTPVGELVEKKPYCYQKIDGKEVEVAVRYEVVERGTYRFWVGGYDKGYDLVIDPEMVYSTYLGGNEDDSVDDIAVDSQGFACVTGFTGSRDFPIIAGAYCTSFHTNFISKINPEGTALVYSTYYGGTEPVYTPPSIAVDAMGNAYVTGEASIGLPLTENAIDRQNAGIFVMKLNPRGNELLFSTYWGSANDDYSRSWSIALDTENSIYITGYTFSLNDFPTTRGAYREKNDFGGYGEFVFVTKFNSEASKVLYSTLIGYGDGTDIVINSMKEAYILGKTTECSPHFPITENAFDKVSNGNFKNKLFITKLNESGSDLIYSTLLGGSDNNNPGGIALDSSSHAYVCGNTESTNFPTTAGAFSPTTDISYWSGFVTKLKDDGSNLEYSTYLGKEYTSIRGIVVDMKDQAIVTGYTDMKTYPTTDNAFKREKADNYNDAILTILSSDGSGLIYSTLWGGDSHDGGNSLTIDGKGNVYVAGETSSSNFPRSYHAADDTLTQTHSGWLDGFVSKFNYDDIQNEVQSGGNKPSEFHMVSIHPNPFNPSTTIEFSLPEPGKIKLTVYSITGQKIYGMQTGRLPAGAHQLRWNGKDSMNKAVSSGAYLIRLENGRESVAQKVLFMK